MSEPTETPSQTVTAVEFLADIAGTIQIIATNLRENRVNRKGLQKCLSDYAARAESDGRLINASRQDANCANRGLFLAYTHMELLSWLATNNYTIPATSVKWYSWKKLSSKYRLPLFSISEQTVELRGLLKNTERVAEQVYADLAEHNVMIPPTSIQYPKVPVGEKVGPPPETIQDLFDRGSRARERIMRGRSE
ncbi:glyoxalase family protein [Penicillium macrosclerotiorum]|uniref:glyoxalase family protein n=1 Tax=Penicillium macrosclerotiorum TaxID=303699 RepID=UPI0025475360|nr:glyoxalase family protein [Penicillium macrosclerotiorum]KAJ5669219.1 glyoxalase family protein [Penicillium macrosclerotiorum]